MVTMSKQELLIEIEYRRRELIELGLIIGLTSQRIIQLSQELDQLIFEFQELIKRNNSE
ncbi:aspartyl-phosphate phosphatase Spo0E family protein [Bacillus sp. RO2]|uniref:aspartyl-phosphate phosphatase Spo0E family protein n=1 Tax=Bacillus sp. RO2 TaxID=2723913 RepID=UPI00145E7BE6|nr:aspartyl-phosphate phosphatase Spo0E family protein [Bacillus sp. RO2]NMH72802.1 aspartyl-phosphate phosphatase Spo0E family protein [Bacillus sp. RO2]